MAAAAAAAVDSGGGRDGGPNFSLEPFLSARVLQLQDPFEYGICRGSDGHGWVVIVHMVHLKSEVVYASSM